MRTVIAISTFVMRAIINFTVVESSCSHLIKPIRGDAMSNSTKARKPDSTVDAWAILFLIILVVGTAVFWVSHQ